MCNPEYQCRSQMHPCSIAEVRVGGIRRAGFCESKCARGDADSLRAKNSRSSFRPCPKPPLAHSPFQTRCAATPLRRTSHCGDKSYYHIYRPLAHGRFDSTFYNYTKKSERNSHLSSIRQITTTNDLAIALRNLLIPLIDERLRWFKLSAPPC